MITTETAERRLNCVLQGTGMRQGDNSPKRIWKWENACRVMEGEEKVFCFVCLLKER